MTFKFTFRVDPVGYTAVRLHRGRHSKQAGEFDPPHQNRLATGAQLETGLAGAEGFDYSRELSTSALFGGSLCTSSRHSFSIKFPLRIRDGFNTFEFTGWLMRGSASARRTGGGLAGIDHELGVCQMGGGRALPKKEPHHLRRGRFPPKTGVDFSCRPQPESGDRGWGFHLRDGTQQSTHATARPVCGLISRRLTPLRRSGHSVSLVRRFSASLPSGHPSRTTFGPSPRRRHPGG